MGWVQRAERVRWRSRSVSTLLLLPLLLSACLAPSRTTAATAQAWCDSQESVVVLGDSHSTGWGLADYDGEGGEGGEGGYAHTEAGWVSSLSRRASAEWGTMTTVLSHIGATAADFRADGRWEHTATAVDTVADVRPALVIVALGANEFARDVAPARFDEHYRGLVDALRNASPRSTVLLLIEPEMGERLVADPAHDWETYTRVIETVAADEGVALLDLGGYLPAGGTREADGLYLPDASHLTAAGHRVVHAAVWTMLSTWCGV